MIIRFFQGICEFWLIPGPNNNMKRETILKKLH